MIFFHRSLLCLCAFSAATAACGGSTIDTPPADQSPSGSTAPAPGPASAPTESAELPAPLPNTPAPIAACRPQKQSEATQGTGSCDVARTSLGVDVAGITWLEPSLAWKPGGRARFEILYTNRSETAPIHYPGLLVASSDPRAQTDTEAHGDGVVHPDLYILTQCTMVASRDHGFTLLSEVPSGTTLTFILAPAVATGNGITSCDDKLPRKTFRVTVP